MEHVFLYARPNARPHSCWKWKIFCTANCTECKTCFHIETHRSEEEISKRDKTERFSAFDMLDGIDIDGVKQWKRNFFFGIKPFSTNNHTTTDTQNNCAGAMCLLCKSALVWGKIKNKKQKQIIAVTFFCHHQSYYL